MQIPISHLHHYQQETSHWHCQPIKKISYNYFSRCI